MEIRNTMIVTNDQSVLRLRLAEVQNFTNNLVIHEETLSAWLSEPEGWAVPVDRSHDQDSTSADAARALMYDEVGA